MSISNQSPELILSNDTCSVCGKALGIERYVWKYHSDRRCFVALLHHECQKKLWEEFSHLNVKEISHKDFYFTKVNKIASLFT